MVFPELKYGSSKIYCGKYSDCYHRSCSPGDPDGGCIVSAGHEVFFHEVGREIGGSGTTKDCAADNKTNNQTNYITHHETNDQTNYTTHHETNDQTHDKTNYSPNNQTHNKANDKANDKAHQLIFSGTVLKSGTSVNATVNVLETGCRKNPGR